MLLIISILLPGCDQDNRSDSLLFDNVVLGVGYGVSGLLFENNLIIWYRENDGPRTDLFSQMYFTRLDQANFPVWGEFPSELLVTGAAARDAIPALVNPKFVSLDSPELSYLNDDDLVLGAIINGEAKAYPQSIMWWHEVANDNIGGIEVLMTFCPLTGSGILFRTPANGKTISRFQMLPIHMIER